jgi:hypothetical protein
MLYEQTSTYVTEGSTHDDGVVAVLLVVVEDLLHGLDTRVCITLVGLTRRLLVPVENLNARDQSVEHR